MGAFLHQIRRGAIGLVLAATQLLVVGVWLSASQATEPAAPAPTAASHKVIYVPPKRGAPANRVGGGSRGLGDSMASVWVIAPQETGLAGTEQPKLYWYVSKPTTIRVELSLVDQKQVEPLLLLNIDPPAGGGFQFVDLAGNGVKLQADVDYQWSVALVVDSDQRSKDVLASGTIRYVPLPPAMQDTLTRESSLANVAVYAAHGYWYDAFAIVMQMSAGSPQDQELIGYRADLLKQVALPDSGN